MKNITHLMILSVSLSLLSACGWHLRGSGNTVEVEQAIYLESTTGEVYKEIQKTLERKKLSVSIAEADLQLILGKEYFDRRSASVNTVAQTTQYQLSLSLTYEILDKESKPLIKESTAELTRYYTYNQNAVNSSDKEEQSLRKEMVRQVSRQILQRINFLSRSQKTP
jgi:LPS-assembly lipoprotein